VLQALQQDRQRADEQSREHHRKRRIDAAMDPLEAGNDGVTLHGSSLLTRVAEIGMIPRHCVTRVHCYMG
jgi:hypothetical protein